MVIENVPELATLMIGSIIISSGYVIIWLTYYILIGDIKEY